MKTSLEITDDEILSGLLLVLYSFQTTDCSLLPWTNKNIFTFHTGTNNLGKIDQIERTY